jgi:hypothetical protein
MKPPQGEPLRKQTGQHEIQHPDAGEPLSHLAFIPEKSRQARL